AVGPEGHARADPDALEQQPDAAVETRVRLEVRIALGQPAGTGGIAAPLPTELAQRRAVGVLNDRALVELERPAGVLQAPGEVGVLARPNALGVAADLFEGSAAHQQV